ncbi:MAG: hypothetical protein K2X55_24980 [Burkholderiaceae bacterium]|nr:hypothetical protein [Burkholderiaceae bacterium]
MNVINTMTSAHVVALLASRQFEVIYQVPYRGTDEEVQNILNLCDGLIQQISAAEVNDRLTLAVGVIDACLIDNLHAQEVRSIIKTIVQKDIELLSHMPCTKAMLARVLRAVGLSNLLAPEKIRRIAKDVQQYQQQYGGGLE